MSQCFLLKASQLSDGLGTPFGSGLIDEGRTSLIEKETAMVVFQPHGRKGLVRTGLSIVEASRDLGVEIETPCGQKKGCGKCKVRIEEGRFNPPGIESNLSHVSEWLEEEGQFITPEERSSGFRLGCCAKIQGDLLIFVPEESRTGKQVVRKTARDIPIIHNPAVKQYYVELVPPSFQDPTGDFERLQKALDRDHGFRELTCDLYALRKLSQTLREGNWKVTVSLWMDREVIRVLPGKADRHFGLAVDIGTTTVAGYFCDLSTMEVLATSSVMNPQCRYGEDVVSRITYGMMNPGGFQRMSEEMIGSLNQIALNVVQQASQKAGEGFWEEKGREGESAEEGTGGLRLKVEDIEDLVLVGNTAMHHILLQLNPESVGLSPFPPVVHRSLDIKARDLGIQINESAYAHFLPVEAGFVGADNVALLVCEEPHKSDEIQLIIDIGTNGELVLGNRERVLSASCATGPAFEGAQLSSGMRAAPGAIERIRISPETHEVDYKVIGREAWRSYSQPGEMMARGICGSGVIDLLAEFYVSGVITKSGSFNQVQKSNRYRIRPETEQPEFVVAWAEETATGKDITVTQKDIRQIQLGKAALSAGCRILLKRMGIDRPDLIKIAGAFGIHVDPLNALVIGLIPDCAIERIQSVGNAAGDGARVSLLNRDKRSEADWCARHVDYVELTVEPDFQDEFIKAMPIPHMTDGYPHLEGVVPKEILNQK